MRAGAGFSVPVSSAAGVLELIGWTLGPLSDSVELPTNRIKRSHPNGLARDRIELLVLLSSAAVPAA